MGSEVPNFIKPSFNLDSPFKTPLPHHTLLASSNGVNRTNPKNPLLQNIEMVPLHSVAYTSLRDLLPATPPGSIIWPTYSDRKDSWREIAIRDPLLQHAAWAYLQPMTAEPENDDSGIFRKLLEGCGGFFGCFGGFFDRIAWRSKDQTLFPANEDDDDS